MSQDILVLVEHQRGAVADISYVMLAAARVLAGGTGGKVDAVLLGQSAQGLAGNLAADRVLYAEHAALAEFTPDAYLRVLASLVKERAPRAVLLGDTTIGADLASVLSMQLGLPLVSRCHSVRAEGGTLKFVSQICGGKILAEGDLPGPTALVTVVPGGYKTGQGQGTQAPEISQVSLPSLAGLRISLKQYIEPEAGDVDISREAILVSVGRGIQTQDNISLAEELARALGGAVCSSRPVVDQGWLPSTRLVGKSGKHVKPKIYLALGISGAPEHAEAITDSDMIVAINTDAAAPIFQIAKYGANADVLEVLPLFTEKVQEAKKG